MAPVAPKRWLTVLMAVALFRNPGVYTAFAAESKPHRPVFAMYYLWYGTPEIDGRWMHWNHSVLPHWRPDVQRKYPQGVSFMPEAGELHSPYQPQGGPYSSRDPQVLQRHFRQMAQHDIDVAVVSWWGRPDPTGGSTADTQGVNTDAVIPAVLDAAAENGVSVAFHMEPYPGRSADSVRADVAYLHEHYLSHPAVFRANTRQSSDGGTVFECAEGLTDPSAARPVLFVYDSYHIPQEQWAPLLHPMHKGGEASVRGTNLDALFIGLWSDQRHGPQLVQGGFDGAYSYFASDGFVYGSSLKNWGSMNKFAEQQHMVFLPCVGPGYDDSRIRPWNSHNTKDREGGAYYGRMWSAAVHLTPPPAGVGITSWNEWGEGTQIEPAVAGAISESEGLDAGTRKALRLSTKYKDYEAEGGPMSYLAATSKWAHLLQSGERPNHKSKCKRAQAQAATAAAAKQGSWLEAAVSGEGQVARL